MSDQHVPNDGRFIRLYDHFKREWQIYVLLSADDHLVLDFPL